MNKSRVSRLIILLLIGSLFMGTIVQTSDWTGVDESVVGKFAREGGRPPSEPYLNVDQGDLKLFFFLLSGAFGGFIFGYRFRQLFQPRGVSS